MSVASKLLAALLADDDFAPLDVEPNPAAQFVMQELTGFTPAELAAIRVGSGYLPRAAPIADTPCARPSHVSFVERAPRHRMTAMRDSDRRCCACGATPAPGALPYGWDWHSTSTSPELQGSCSPACRVRAGLRERRDLPPGAMSLIHHRNPPLTRAYEERAQPWVETPLVRKPEAPQ